MNMHVSIDIHVFYVRSNQDAILRSNRLVRWLSG